MGHSTDCRNSLMFSVGERAWAKSDTTAPRYGVRLWGNQRLYDISRLLIVVLWERMWYDSCRLLSAVLSHERDTAAAAFVKAQITAARYETKLLP